MTTPAITPQYIAAEALWNLHYGQNAINRWLTYTDYGMTFAKLIASGARPIEVAEAEAVIAALECHRPS